MNPWWNFSNEHPVYLLYAFHQKYWIISFSTQSYSFHFPIPDSDRLFHIFYKFFIQHMLVIVSFIQLLDEIWIDSECDYTIKVSSGLWNLLIIAYVRFLSIFINNVSLCLALLIQWTSERLLDTYISSNERMKSACLRKVVEKNFGN